MPLASARQTQHTKAAFRDGDDDDDDGSAGEVRVLWTWPRGSRTGSLRHELQLLKTAATSGRFNVAFFLVSF